MYNFFFMLFFLCLLNWWFKYMLNMNSNLVNVLLFGCLYYLGFGSGFFGGKWSWSIMNISVIFCSFVLMLMVLMSGIWDKIWWYGSKINISLVMIMYDFYCYFFMLGIIN